MIKLKEAVIVEGRYDKIKLKNLVDAPIIETNGFRIFNDKERRDMIRQIADRRGILIMTDSDGAGLVIRNFLNGAVDKSKIKHCYIPQLEGKEKRKEQRSKEGFLGVEGVPDDVIIEAIRKSGANSTRVSVSALGPFSLATRSKYGVRMSHIGWRQLCSALAHPIANMRCSAIGRSLRAIHAPYSLQAL